MLHTVRPVSRRLLQRPPAQGGLLIEVLVAMFILSLAVLGSVALQLNSIAQTRQAINLTVASAAAQELAELIHNNSAHPAALDAYLNPTPITLNDRAAPAHNCINAGCNALRLAQWEKEDWLRRLQSRVPGAHVAVCRDTAAYASDGRAQWQCTAAANDAAVPQVWVKIAWPERQLNRSAAQPDATKLVNTFGDDGDKLRPIVMVPVVLRTPYIPPVPPAD